MDGDLSETPPLNGWRRQSPPSLPEANASLPIPQTGGF